jgi:septum formation protein
MSDGRPIILASTSLYRRELLSRLRIPFEVVAPDVDEAEGHWADLEPSQIAASLASAKAAAVASRFPEAIVIGSDQVACIENRILTKPGTREKAIEQLGYLAGQPHLLWTAVTIQAGHQSWDGLDKTQLWMSDLSREAICRYVDVENPLDCAGAYKFESLGISLFEKVETHDPTAIVGLPMIFVARVLRQLGIAVP